MYSTEVCMLLFLVTKGSSLEKDMSYLTNSIPLLNIRKTLSKALWVGQRICIISI
jgi:hypothetical protein